MKCIIHRWYDTPEAEMKTIIPIFGKEIFYDLIDIILEVIKASKSLMKNFVADFYTKASSIIVTNINTYHQNNFNISFLDAELTCKCLELISIIIKILPEYIAPCFEQSNLIEVIYQLIDIHDVNINNYLFILIGEFKNLPKSQLISRHIEKITFFLKLYLTSPENFPDLSGKTKETDRSYICAYNNCCFSIGSLSVNFGNEISGIVDSCMNMLVRILSYPKVVFIFKIRLINL